MTPEQPDSPSPGRLRPVSSRQNALVKELRRAFAHSGPADDGSVAVEGVTLVWEALRSHRRLVAVFVSETGLDVYKRQHTLLGRPAPALRG